MLDALKAALLDTIYPPRCLACTEATDRAHGLCAACWRDTHFVTGAACGRCGVPLIGEEAPGDLCEGCLRHPPAWDTGAAVMLYRGAGRRMVLALKHGDRLDMVRPLAGWMARAGQAQLGRAELIAPVPLHWRRLVRRRYNQSAELVRALSRTTGVPAVTDLLVRRRHTVPQERMDREARRRNQAGAVAVGVRHAARLRGRSVVLVDDVLTSGATLSGCAEALRAAGAARVDVLVLCRVAFEDAVHI
jgi:ComF family protein